MKYIIKLDKSIYERVKQAKCVPDMYGTDIVNSMNAVAMGTEVPEGEWIPHYLENLLWGHNECPFCHKRSNRGANFCQNCGAHLTEPKE